MSNEAGSDNISKRMQRVQEIKDRLINCKEHGTSISEDDGLIRRLFGSYDNGYQYADENGNICSSLILEAVNGLSSSKKGFDVNSYRGTNEFDDDMLQDVAFAVLEKLNLNELTVEDIQNLDLERVIRDAFNKHYRGLGYKDKESVVDTQELDYAAAKPEIIDTSFVSEMAGRLAVYCGCSADSSGIKTSCSQNYQYKKKHRNTRKQEYLQKYFNTKKLKDKERDEFNRGKLKRLHRLEEPSAPDFAAPSDTNMPETERSKAWRKRRLIYRVKFYKAKHKKFTI